MDNFTKEDLKDFFIGLTVVVFAIIAAGIYKWQSTIWANAQNTDYAIYASFNRTDGLEVGDKVRMAGIDIGYISDSVLDDNFRATLTLMIKSDIVIPNDSSASIVSSGIMGNKYIEIEAGGSEDYLTEGSEFDYTQDAMVIEELVDRIISLGKAKRNTKNKTPTTEVCTTAEPSVQNTNEEDE